MEMVGSLEELKSSRSVSGKNFPNFEMLDTKDCLCSEQDHPEFPSSKRRLASRNRKPKERTGFYEDDSE